MDCWSCFMLRNSSCINCCSCFTPWSSLCINCWSCFMLEVPYSWNADLASRLGVLYASIVGLASCLEVPYSWNADLASRLVFHLKSNQAYLHSTLSLLP